MDHAPPPAWEETINRLTAHLVGTEMATRFGPAGKVRFTTLTPASLGLEAAARARLAASVVFLVPGGTWPGVSANGAGWLPPWAKELERLGVGRAVPLPLMPDRDPVTATFEPLLSQLTGHHQAYVTRKVTAELAARPPGPGGGAWLLGHSYGSLLAFETAGRLRRDLGPVMAGAIALETHLATTGFFARHAPAVPTVVVAENEDGYWPSAPAGTTVHRVHVPELTHMDLVLRPPAALLRTLVRAIAGEASP